MNPPVTLPVIERSFMDESIELLNNTARMSSLALVEGKYGTGKTRLLDYWIGEKLTGIQPDQVVRTELRSTVKAKDSNGINSSKTILILSQLHYVLTRREHEHPLRRKHLIEEFFQTHPAHSQKGFSRLERKVLAYLEEYQIRSLVIDNAHLLDASTLEWLLYLRDHESPRRSLIFCAQIQDKEEASHTVRLAFSNVQKATDSLTAKIQIEPLTRREFSTDTMPRLLRKLDIDVAPETSFVSHVWDWTQGNWVRIDRVIRLFLSQFEGRKPPYVVTQKHVLHVKQQLVNAELDT
jgi:hypothetical protein